MRGTGCRILGGAFRGGVGPLSRAQLVPPMQLTALILLPLLFLLPTSSGPPPALLGSPLVPHRTIGGTILSMNSTTVISAPRRPQTEAISRPMMPPPMTTIFSGTALREMAPVDDTILRSLRSEATAAGMVVSLGGGVVTSCVVEVFVCCGFGRSVYVMRHEAFGGAGMTDAGPRALTSPRRPGTRAGG